MTRGEADTALRNAYTNFRDKCVHVRQLTQNHAASRWVVGLVGYVCGAGDGVAVVGRRWVPIGPWGAAHGDVHVTVP